MQKVYLLLVDCGKKKKKTCGSKLTASSLKGRESGREGLGSLIVSNDYFFYFCFCSRREICFCKLYLFSIWTFDWLLEPVIEFNWSIIVSCFCMCDQVVWWEMGRVLGLKCAKIGWNMLRISSFSVHVLCPCFNSFSFYVGMLWLVW